MSRTELIAACKQGLTRKKIARARHDSFSLGTEAYIRKVAKTEQDRQDLRDIIKQASGAAAHIHKTLRSGDPRRVQQIKTAFAQIGVPVVSENEMKQQHEKFAKELAAAGVKTAKEREEFLQKVSTDRSAAFELGTEVYIEKVGMDDATAEQFRGIIAEGLEQAQQNPAAAREALSN